MKLTKDPYEILGVDKSATMQEINSAYRRLTKKYHPDLNPNDYIASEAMKEINRAYDAIKTGDFSEFAERAPHCEETENKTDTERNHNEQKEENTSNNESPNEEHSKDDFADTLCILRAKINAKTNRLYAILSFALFAGSAYLLFEYVFKLCTYDKLMNFFNTGFTDESIFKPDPKRVAEFLPNISAETYVAVLVKMILAVAILFTAVLLLTALYNIFYICIHKKTEKLCADSNYLDYDDFCKAAKNMRTLKIVNIIYAVITYITLLLTLAAAMMYTVIQSAYFFQIHFSTYKIFMIGIAIVMFVVLAIFISGKCDRIKEQKCLEIGAYIENLDTFIKGMGMCLIPILIIIAFIMLVLYIILKVIAAIILND